MNFKRADKIIHDLYIASIIFAIMFFILRNTNSPLKWVSLAAVIVTSVICFPLNWKYMRCPYCDHIISSFRRSQKCAVCGKNLVIGADGNLVKLDKTPSKYPAPGRNSRSGHKKKKKK